MAESPANAQAPNQTSAPIEAAHNLVLGGDRFIIYSQSKGTIEYHDSDQAFLIGKGWAGHGAGKNNPELQTVKETGPLPRGWYKIGQPQSHPTVGPFALRLTPDEGNEMFGRDGFLIHGASLNPLKRGEESKGCIVAMRSTREKIHDLGVTRLWVVL